MKQRLIGAAVLVALAVIFLPMLVKGPAPDSGVSDVPLKAPDAPATDYEIRDLPLVMPSDAPNGGAVGMQAHPGQPPAAGDGQAALPMPAEQPDAAQVGDITPVQVPAADNPDAADLASTPAKQPAAPPPAPAAKLPASTAGGDYAVSFGSFTTSGSADKVIASLRAAGLPSYRESATVDRKAVQRVRIGPYATRADAEAARQQALRVRDDVNAQVVVLDAEVAPAKPAKPATTPASASPAKQPATKPASPAAASTGFAVQVGAFTKPADAVALRDKLRAAGFSAFTEAVATAQGNLTRVRAGPVATHADADQLKAQLKAKVGIDGIVRPHP